MLVEKNGMYSSNRRKYNRLSGAAARTGVLKKKT